MRIRVRLTTISVILSIEVTAAPDWLATQRILMPKDKYEDEIEEILQNADPDDELSSNREEPPDAGTPQGSPTTMEPKEGKLVAWDEVPTELPEPRRQKSRSSRSSSAPIFTSNRLIVAAVVLFVIGLAVRPILLYMFIAAAILGAGAYLMSQNEKKSQPQGRSRRRTKFWRDAPIDFGDDDDDDAAPPNQWRGG